jgi:hypothetical protein
MAEPTREEIDAKIAAVDARVETRFVELAGKIDRIADAVNIERTPTILKQPIRYGLKCKP